MKAANVTGAPRCKQGVEQLHSRKLMRFAKVEFQHPMKNYKHHEQLALLPYLGKWLLLASVVAVLAGSASAFFLFALDWVTSTRLAHRWLIWLLPVAGFVVGWL